MDYNWRTSSFSGAGNDCVEVAPPRGRDVSWRLRDSKRRAGGVIHVTQRGWDALRATLTREL